MARRGASECPPKDRYAPQTRPVAIAPACNANVSTAAVQLHCLQPAKAIVLQHQHQQHQQQQQVIVEAAPAAAAAVSSPVAVASESVPVSAQVWFSGGHAHVHVQPTSAAGAISIAIASGGATSLRYTKTGGKQLLSMQDKAALLAQLNAEDYRDYCKSSGMSERRDHAPREQIPAPCNGRFSTKETCKNSKDVCAAQHAQRRSRVYLSVDS